jgi:hypothetical protein
LYSFEFKATGNVPWSAGYNPNVSGDAATFLNGNFLSIWPAANGGSTTLGSTVLVTLAGPDGKAVTRAVNVRQLGREMNFKATPENPYAAAGVTDQTFPVSSEATWKLSTAETDLALEDKLVWYPATTTDYPYHFSLEPNPYYVARDITVNVTSSHPEFAPRSFDIKQAGTAPYITITDPSPILSYDFGLTGTAKTVAFTTNAKWKFATDATYADVIASAETGGAGASTETVYDLGATALAPENGSITFTLRTDAGTLAAGAKSTKITFNTDPAGSPKEVTLSRVIPALFTNIGISPANGSDIAATATDVSVTVDRNVRWWIQQGSEEEKYSSDDGYKAGDKLTVTVPKRDTRVADSWTNNNTVTVKAGYDAQNGIAGASPGNYSFTQLPYTLKVTGVATSGSVTLTVETNATEYSLILKADNINGTPLVTTGYISGTPKTYTLTTNPTTRDVVIINAVTGLKVGSFTQPGLKYVFVKHGSGGVYGNANGVTSAKCPDGYTAVNYKLGVGTTGVTWADGSAVNENYTLIIYGWTATTWESNRSMWTGGTNTLDQNTSNHTNAWGWSSWGSNVGAMACVN